MAAPGFASPTATARFRLLQPHLEDDVPLSWLAAVVRMTRGNLRLAERLLAQMRRIMDLNGTQAVSTDIVDAARDRLVIGPGD